MYSPGVPKADALRRPRPLTEHELQEWFAAVRAAVQTAYQRKAAEPRKLSGTSVMVVIACGREWVI
jgi:hypothetical protein